MVTSSSSLKPLFWHHQKSQQRKRNNESLLSCPSGNNSNDDHQACGVAKKGNLKGPKHGKRFACKTTVLGIAFVTGILLCCRLLEEMVFRERLHHWAYRHLLYWGIYNPDPDCSIPNWEYPWCEHAAVDGPPLRPEEWLDLRRKYQQALTDAGSTSTDGSSFGSSGLGKDWDRLGTTGFHVGVQIRNSTGKGRGLFPTERIEKGDKIWDDRYSAVFHNECSARHFFASLTDKQVCEVMLWGYSNNLYGNGTQFMLDLDGGVYCNHNESANVVHYFVDDELDDPTAGVGEHSKEPKLVLIGPYFRQQQQQKRFLPGSFASYATRTIEVGEEILCNYNEFQHFDPYFWHEVLYRSIFPRKMWAS